MNNKQYRSGKTHSLMRNIKYLDSIKNSKGKRILKPILIPDVKNEYNKNKGDTN